MSLEFQLQVADQAGLIVNGQFVPAGESSTSSKGRKSSKSSGRSISANELYLENTRQDRKASGSYYTPDYIVKYIVEQTVGPVLEQRAKRFGDQINSLRSLRTQASRTNDSGVAQHLRQRIEQEEHAAIETLLDIKVLDPAMGSGHFLVEAVNYLSDHLSTILHKYPDNPLLARLQKIRADIRKNLLEQGIKADVILDDQLSDRVLLRRMVMKRCIYGVDLNEMAVDLAKLSLWLDSFAIGAPLSFLDHHLRWGNSLIGIWDIEQYIDFTSARGQQFINALGHMVQVTQLSDSTSAEVADSKQLYAAAQEGLRPFREQLHIDLATHFVDLGDIAQARRVAHTSIDDRAKRHHPETLAKFEKAQQAAEERRFFHWKLEFPEVFVDYNKRDWKAKEEAGFDAVIGNPPWGGEINSHTFSFLKNDFSNLHQRLADTTKYFFGLADRIVIKKGFIGQIIPNVLLHFSEYEKWRKLLIKNYTIIDIINLGDSIFDNVTAPSCMIIVQHISANEDHKSNIWNLKSISRTDVIDLPRKFITSINQQFFLSTPNHIFTSDNFIIKILPKVQNISDVIENLAKKMFP